MLLGHLVSMSRAVRPFEASPARTHVSPEPVAYGQGVLGNSGAALATAGG